LVTCSAPDSRVKAGSPDRNSGEMETLVIFPSKLLNFIKIKTIMKYKKKGKHSSSQYLLKNLSYYLILDGRRIQLGQILLESEG